MMDAHETASIAAAIAQAKTWLVEQEDQRDPTVAELISALDVAWLAASRLRLERDLGSLGEGAAMDQEGSA